MRAARWIRSTAWNCGKRLAGVTGPLVSAKPGLSVSHASTVLPPAETRRNSDRDDSRSSSVNAETAAMAASSEAAVRARGKSTPSSASRLARTLASAAPSSSAVEANCQVAKSAKRSPAGTGVARGWLNREVTATAQAGSAEAAFSAARSSAVMIPSNCTTARVATWRTRRLSAAGRARPTGQAASAAS
jgi:hypothetical protein